MISEEKIKENFTKYIESGKKNNFLTEELINFLGVDFIKAPASALKSQFNAYDGGLICHLLRVTKFAIEINNSLPANMKVNQESLIKVCFLHQIGKVRIYKPCESEWHKTNQGKMYDYTNENETLKIGERSALYALRYGVQLSDEEYAAIINHDKQPDDKILYFSGMLSVILRQANELAVRESKLIFNN